MDAWPGRLVPDRSLRVIDGGRVLIGGSPLTVLRFTEPIDLDAVASPTVAARLVDLGMAHPAPEVGPFTACDITAVIPVRDEPDSVARTLDALALVEPPPFEVIVVDDGSTDPDGLSGLVSRGDWPMPVGLVRLARNTGPAAARNAGLDLVSTPLVLFIDAGCTPERQRGEPTRRDNVPVHDTDWFRPLLGHFADPSLALVAPRIRSGPAQAPKRSGRHRGRRMTNLVARYEQQRSPLDLGDEAARVAPRTRVAYVPTACVLARVDALRAIGGFDETLRVGEDVDLVWRLGETSPPWRVRYEPAAVVRHDTRTLPADWLARRVVYGTSAALLDRRHPGSVAPASVSPWSAAAWGLVAIGQPVAGAGTAAASTVLLTHKLERLPDPWREAMHLAGLGNLAAGRLLADAVRRAWWPAAGIAVAVGPRPLRRTAVAAFVVPPLVEWVTTRPDLDPLSYVCLRTADDLAYGVGVWLGCIRERTVGPLVPDFGAGRIRRRNPISPS